MRADQIEEVEVTVEKKSKPTNKSKSKAGRPSIDVKEKRIPVPGSFTPKEKERIVAVAKKEGYSVAHFMRVAGLKLLEELE